MPQPKTKTDASRSADSCPLVTINSNRFRINSQEKTVDIFTIPQNTLSMFDGVPGKLVVAVNNGHGEHLSMLINFNLFYEAVRLLINEEAAKDFGDLFSEENQTNTRKGEKPNVRVRVKCKSRPRAGE